MCFYAISSRGFIFKCGPNVVSCKHEFVLPNRTKQIFSLVHLTKRRLRCLRSSTSSSSCLHFLRFFLSLVNSFLFAMQISSPSFTFWKWWLWLKQYYFCGFSMQFMFNILVSLDWVFIQYKRAVNLKITNNDKKRLKYFIWNWFIIQPYCAAIFVLTKYKFQVL